MIEKTNNKTIEKKSDIMNLKEEILQKADRMLSVINNINRQGGVTTQLQMAAACIELQRFDWYLEETYLEKVIDRNDFPDLPKLEEYIRLFKNVEQDFFDDLYGGHHNTKQREEDIEIISYLKEEIINNQQLRQYEEDYLDSWKELKTDIEMLSVFFNYLLRIVVSELESIYQEIRRQEVGTVNMTSPNKKGQRKNFREFIKDSKRTEEIIEKLHRLIGKKTNSDALRIITRACWIKWLDKKPTATSIKTEFPTITCTDSQISAILKEPKPTKNGKVDEERIERIRKEYEDI